MYDSMNSALHVKMLLLNNKFVADEYLHSNASDTGTNCDIIYRIVIKWLLYRDMKILYITHL